MKNGMSIQIYKFAEREKGCPSHYGEHGSNKLNIVAYDTWLNIRHCEVIKYTEGLSVLSIQICMLHNAIYKQNIVMFFSKYATRCNLLILNICKHQAVCLLLQQVAICSILIFLSNMLKHSEQVWYCTCHVFDLTMPILYLTSFFLSHKKKIKNYLKVSIFKCWQLHTVQ